jgi:hypothetical protein
MPILAAGSPKSSRAIRSGPSHLELWLEEDARSTEGSIGVELERGLVLEAELRGHLAEHRDPHPTAEVLGRGQNVLDRDHFSADDVVEDSLQCSAVGDARQVDDRASVGHRGESMGYRCEVGDPAGPGDLKPGLLRPHDIDGHGDPDPWVDELRIYAAQSRRCRMAEPGAIAGVQESGDGSRCRTPGGRCRDHDLGMDQHPEPRGDPVHHLPTAQAGLVCLRSSEGTELR